MRFSELYEQTINEVSDLRKQMEEDLQDALRKEFKFDKGWETSNDSFGVYLTPNIPGREKYIPFEIKMKHSPGNKNFMITSRDDPKMWVLIPDDDIGKVVKKVKSLVKRFKR